jgi:hypothetical protein
MSDFIRATVDMLAYERERDSSLVVGAALPGGWLEAPGGVRVRDLHTWYGVLALSAHGDAYGATIIVRGVEPPGGVEVRAPFDRHARSVVVNGHRASLIDAGRAVLVRAPAVVEFRY